MPRQAGEIRTGALTRASFSSNMSAMPLQSADTFSRNALHSSSARSDACAPPPSLHKKTDASQAWCCTRNQARMAVFDSRRADKRREEGCGGGQAAAGRGRPDPYRRELNQQVTLRCHRPDRRPHVCINTRTRHTSQHVGDIFGYAHFCSMGWRSIAIAALKCF